MASSCSRRNLISTAGDDIHHRTKETFAARHYIWSGTQMINLISGLFRFRRGSWEMLATVIIAAGVFMLMQPFVMWAYTYSFITTLVGTVMFIIVSHFPE